MRNWRVPREGGFWLAVAAVTVFAGWLKTINLLLLFGYLMLGLFAINALVARAMARRVSAARVPLGPGFAGQSTPRAADVRNRTPRPAVVSVRESSPVHDAAWFLPSLAGGDIRRIATEFIATRRGHYIVSPLVASSGYPFGLIHYSHAVADAETLDVLPARGQVDLGRLRRWLIRTGVGDANTRRPIRHHSIHQADVRGVRPYRPGDSLRDVHWRTTARRGSLMVREYDSADPLDLLLVVEPWLPADPTPADRQRLEDALSLAASVFWAWGHGDETPEATLVVAGGGGSRSGRATEGFVRQALTLLAGVQGTAAPHELPMDRLRTRTNRCVRMVVSSRSAAGLAGDLRARTGLPFVPADPSMRFAWYRPPGVAP